MPNQDGRKERVAIYARVSGLSQARDGGGLKDQVAACRAWARERGARVVDVFRDEGVSGKLEERAALALALEALKTGAVDAVVVSNLDRLARSLYVQESVLRDVDRYGGKLYSVAQPDLDGDDPTRVLFRQIVGAVAEYDRAMTVARLRAAKNRERARRGYAVANPRFGYRVERGAIVADKTEQEVFAVMRRLRGEGRSLRAVAAELDARGFKPRRAKRWHPHSVGRALARGNKPY